MSGTNQYAVRLLDSLGWELFKFRLSRARRLIRQEKWGYSISEEWTNQDMWAPHHYTKKLKMSSSRSLSTGAIVPSIFENLLRGPFMLLKKESIF